MKNGRRKIYSLSHFVLNLGVIDEDDDPSLVELNIESLNEEFAVELNNLRAQLQFHNMQMTQAALQNKEEFVKCEVQLDKFLDDYLSKNGTWAGLETIQAVSKIFKTNVIVFNEWGRINCGNSFDSSYKDIITIAFRLDAKVNRSDKKMYIILSAIIMIVL